MRINMEYRSTGRRAKRAGVEVARTRRRAKRAGVEVARTLSVASQMALLCPSGMDVWMQRELGAGFGLPRHGSTPKQ